jgi:hypothetical protein
MPQIARTTVGRSNSPQDFSKHSFIVLRHTQEGFIWNGPLELWLTLTEGGGCI